MPTASVTPNTDQVSTPLQDPAAGAPQAAPAAAAPAAPNRPGLFGRILQGALTGLAGGGVAGAIDGGVLATNPESFYKMQVAKEQRARTAEAHTKEAENLPKMQDAQTAALLADTMMKQRQIDQMPAELKLNQEKAAQSHLEFMTNTYGPASQVTQYDPNDPNDTASMASMQQAAATNGGTVPPVLTVHSGDQLFHWNANDMAASPAMGAHINAILKVLGRPQQQIPGDPKAKLAMLTSLQSLVEPDTTVEKSKVNGYLVGAQQALKASPADDQLTPTELGIKKQLQARVAFLQQVHDSNMSDDKVLAGQKAGAAQAATQPTKDTEIGKTELSKLWTDPSKGYAAAYAQGKQTIDSLKAGADGNGLITSMAPTMEVLGINHAAGISRISPAEAQAAGMPGGWAERWNGWANKALAGKLSPQLASEGKQLMNIVLDTAHAKAVQSAAFVAQNRGLDPSKAPALARNGRFTTLDKVTGTPRYGILKGQRVVSYDNGKTTQPAE